MKFQNVIAAASIAALVSAGTAFAADSARNETHMYLEKPVKGQGSIVFNGDQKTKTWSPHDVVFNGATLDINFASPGLSNGGDAALSNPT